jgi:hypothetical protein
VFGNGRRSRTSIVLVTGLIGACLAYGLNASATQTSRRAGRTSDHAKRGQVYDGLQPGADDRPCRGAYEAHMSDGTTMCSHGPDPATDGVDVQRHRTTEELANTTETTDGSGTGLVPCYGDGASGPRVQAIYVRSADVADRFTDISTLIPQWAGKADAVFASSAAATGGVRHVRWLTSADCSLAITNVVLSTTGDDTLTNTISELKAKGFNRTDRKYLIWADATRYCGIGTVKNDDRAGADNANNAGPSFARVDSGCWGSSSPTEAHELMHNLGGVQLSAPHTTGGWHCTDESDRMCYPDASGVSMTYPCAATGEQLFDCGHDDYFTTAAAGGSYLGTHWNAANSVFLSSAAPDAWGGGSQPTSSPSPAPATPTPTPTVAPTPTPAPTPSTITTTFTDSLNKKISTRTYSITAGPGMLSSSISFTRATTLIVTVRDAAGNVLAQGSGQSPSSLSAQVTGGTYSVSVSGSPASYSLAVTRPA